MFFQPPDNEPTNTDNTVKSSGALKSARRKRRKLDQRYKNKTRLLKKEKQRFANSMSSWAENFTMAATWQLKHQVAHWKSRARAFEHENKVLRRMLRQYNVNDKASSENTQETYNVEAMSAESGSDNEEVSEEQEEDDGNDEEGEKLVVSEEWLDFLAKNTETRIMQLERERKRKLEREAPMKLLESCPVVPTDQTAEYEELYGPNWQRIAALEMSMQSQFIADCDKYKPVYWPTLPLKL